MIYATQSSEEMRLQRLAERLHALGPAPMLHAMRDVAGGADLCVTLERYAALPADLIHGLGGDCFAEPVRLVSGARS